MSDEWELIAWVRDEAHGRHGVDSREFDAFIDGAEWGAGWAFAIVGMAMAIRESYCCDSCGNWTGLRGYCFCENDD